MALVDRMVCGSRSPSMIEETSHSRCRHLRRDERSLNHHSSWQGERVLLNAHDDI